MKKLIIYNDSRSPSCCRAVMCSGRLGGIDGNRAYYFKSDDTYMCLECFRAAQDYPWAAEAEKIKIARKKDDRRFHSLHRNDWEWENKPKAV